MINITNIIWQGLSSFIFFILWKDNMIKIRGGSRIFMGRGRKKLSADSAKSLTAGFQGPLKGPGSSRLEFTF